MKILIFSGSANPEGQTARAVKTICKGISEAGGFYETFFLPKLKLERCRQCDINGWGDCRYKNRCVIEDDFQMLLEKIKSSDVLVFANPVYFGDLSESLRCFLDRYRRTLFSKITRPPAPGSPPSFMPSGGPPVVGLCYAGGSGNGTISCLAGMEKILQNCGFDIVDMIPIRRQNMELKLPYLESVGRWLVTKPSSGPFVDPHKNNPSSGGQTT